jgi:hypothetical protein
MRQPHHGRGGSRHIGRIRTRLAKIISRDLGIDCQPEHLRPATGSWRTDWRLDVYRWEVFARTKSGQPFVAGCWESMTDCVKAGAVRYDGDGEIYPKPKQK